MLHAYPRLRRVFIARHPAIEGYVVQLESEHDPTEEESLAVHEDGLLWELADWILYQRAPELYDQSSEFDTGLSAISDVATLDGKIVIDAGAGTGQMAIAVARSARHVFAVEPAATLRSFIRDRAAQLEVDNLFVVDGFLHQIPLPADTADVLLTRQAIGWNLHAEVQEIERVLKSDGIALHLAGPPPEPPVDDLHRELLAHGYEPGTYIEGSVEKRRYWRRFGDHPSVD